MPNLEPTYLRYIYDGLVKGSIHPENAAELPEGLIGLYEEAFDERTSVVERQKLLQRFAIWALLKKEVSAAFIAEVLGEPEEEILDFISTYSAWFNSPDSGKYQLYHERLKVYLLQKLSDKEINDLNVSLIKHLKKSKKNEFEMYRIQFYVFHLLTIDSCNEAYLFLINSQTFIDAQKYFEATLFLNTQYDLTIRKFAQLNKELEVAKLISVQHGFLEKSLRKIIEKPELIFNNDVFTETVEASSRLTINKQKVFWQTVLLSILKKTNETISVNKVLRDFDHCIEMLDEIRRENNDKFHFDNISRKDFFLLLNYLLQNGLEINWLLNRYDWFPDYTMSRDGILEDSSYFSDFKFVNTKFKNSILKFLRAQLNKTKFSDLYRSKAWCLKFISKLSEIETTNELVTSISLDDLVFDPNNIEEKQLYKSAYEPKYYPATIYYSRINSYEQLDQIVQSELSQNSYLNSFLNELDLEDFSGAIEITLIDCLVDFCSLEPGANSAWTVQDERIESISMFFLIVLRKKGASKFCQLFEYFLNNVELSIWNEYIGEVGPFNKEGLSDRLMVDLLPMLLVFENKSYLNSIIENNISSKKELILCLCDIHKNQVLSYKWLPKYKNSEIILFFGKEPEKLFHVATCLNVNLQMLYDEITKLQQINFYNSILFAKNSFLTTEIIEGIEKNLTNLKPKELQFLEGHLQRVFTEILQSDLITKNITALFLEIIINSKNNFNVTEFYNRSNEKALFLMKIRNNSYYINQLFGDNSRI